MDQEFINHLKKYLNDEEIKQLINSFSLPNKHALLLNTNKMDKKTFLDLFPECIQHPIVDNAFIYDKDKYDFGKNILHELGVYYLQEPSALTVAHYVDAKENEVILDMCAAPGGKTIGAALSMNSKGLLISNDISADRCRAIKDNVSRLGLKNVLVTNNDFKYIYQNFYEVFDKIILDAPCSGSGMFRKEEKMIEDWSINKVYKNAMIQMELIEMAYYMLKRGGKLIYSTCSYSYEEDEAVVTNLLSRHDDLSLENISNNLFFESKEKIGVHLFPHLFPGEGHYIAVIKKAGSAPATKNIANIGKCKINIPLLKNFEIQNFNNQLYALPFLIKYKGLNIYQYGIHIGELIHNEVKYSYEMAHCLNSYENEIELDEQDIYEYIQGGQLNKITDKHGQILLKYKKISVDFSKTNGEIIKNHYPKYLRKKVII